MNKDRRCVISGIGLATPVGNDLETFWQTLKQSTSQFEEMEVFAGDTPHQRVYRIDDQKLNSGLSGRQLKKLDRFTILALVATAGALQDSGIQIDDETRDLIGIIIGNSMGGWSYVEPMMYPLYTEGMGAINPYVATAWFPAAPQGEISILHKIGGYSKTVCAERLSAGFALEQSLWVINSGRANVMLVGGAESPLNSLVLNVYLQGNRISPSGQYRPFSPEADGYLLGEGAAILCLESWEQAQERGAKIYCEILAIGKGSSLVQAMQTCLKAADIRGEEIDYVLLDGIGEQEKDDEEYRAIEAVLGMNANVRMSAPKSMYGNTIGASMAIDVAVACLSLERQTVVPTAAKPGEIKNPATGKHVVTTPEQIPLKHVLVNGRDQNGQSCVVLLAKKEDKAATKVEISGN